MIRISFCKLRHAKHLLRWLAWLSAIVPAMTAFAAEEGWVEKKPQPVLIVSSAGPAQAAIAHGQGSAPASVYRLNNSDHSDVAPPVTPLEESQGLHIVVSLKPRNAEELDRLVDQAGAQQKPLTAAEIKARYAPTDSQAQAVAAYLKKNDFTGIEVAPNNMLVSADGHPSNVQSAFRVDMKRFTYQGRQVYANAAPAQVSVELGSIVESVLGLQNVFVPRTLAHPRMPIMRRPVDPASSGH